MSKTIHKHYAPPERYERKNKSFKVRIQESRNRQIEEHIRYILRHFEPMYFKQEAP
jgi:hypothetical protein